MKHCKKCDTTKSLDEFHNNKSAKGGKASYCKPCWNAYMRDQAVKHSDRKNAKTAEWYQNNKERKKAQVAEWRAANADHLKAQRAAYREANREKLREAGREYTARTSDRRKAEYRANPEPAKARSKAWQAKNIDKVVERNRRWREANPERYREHMRMGSARRRARMALLPTFDLAPKDLRRILASSCAVDGCESRDIHIDHIIPIARGGSHGVGNLQALCASHNSSKGARLWIEFRRYLVQRDELIAA